MCKFTSVSDINKSLSEWSLDRFSLMSASLISPEKRTSSFWKQLLCLVSLLFYAAIRNLSVESHTLFNMKIWLTLFLVKEEKKLIILFLTVLKSKCNMQRENLLTQSTHISGHLCSEQREDVQLVSLPQAPQLVSLWKIGEKFLYSSQYVNQTTGITVL